MAVVEELDDRVTSVPVPAPGVRTWTLRLDPRPRDARTAGLDPADLERLSGVRPVDAARLLARRSLTRSIVAHLGNCRPADVRLSSAGGPWAVEVPGAPPWFLSLSASGARGLLALASGPVGVDLEVLPGPPDALLVSEHLLAPAEQDWIRRGGRHVPRRFLATWVRKEAVVKCTGEGLSRDLRSFVVDASRSSAPVHDAEGTPLGIRTTAVDIDGHEAALALAEPRDPAGVLGRRPPLVHR